MSDKTNLIETYRGYKIRLFHNSGKWDYNVPNIDSRVGKSKLHLYNTRARAIQDAKREVDAQLGS